jgi:putative PIN family toxin of toxin-antitoxin system
MGDRPKDLSENKLPTSNQPFSSKTAPGSVQRTKGTLPSPETVLDRKSSGHKRIGYSRTSPRPRVVIDTNVLISGIVFGGKPRRVFDLLAERSIIVIIAEELLTEARRKIGMKFPDFIEDLERIEKLLKRDALLVRLGTVQVAVSRDPDDDKFIEAALVGAAGFIVSGDKDLLIIKKHEDIQIVTPAEFLDIISDSVLS